MPGKGALGNMHQTIVDLLGRSNRLGADKRVTNFAGGNTSAKLTLPHPITGEDRPRAGGQGIRWRSRHAHLRGLGFARSRARASPSSGFTRGSVHEDEIVDMYAYCRFGEGGAVPSIDTPLDSFVVCSPTSTTSIPIRSSCWRPRPTVRRSSPTATARGRLVGWKRPGFQLGLALRDFRMAHPDASGAIMGGHGMICWSETLGRVRAVVAAPDRDPPSGSSPSAAGWRRSEASPVGVRGARRGGTSVQRQPSWRRPIRGHRPAATARWSARSPTVLSCSTSWPRRRPPSSPRSARRARTTSSGRRSSHCCSISRRAAPLAEPRIARLAELHEAYRADYAGHDDAHAVARLPRHARRRPCDRARAGGRHVELRHRLANSSRPPASSTSTRST